MIGFIAMMASLRYASLLNSTPIYKAAQTWGANPALPRLSKEQVLQFGGKGHSEAVHPHYSYILNPQQNLRIQCE